LLYKLKNGIWSGKREIPNRIKMGKLFFY